LPAAKLDSEFVIQLDEFFVEGNKAGGLLRTSIRPTLNILLLIIHASV